MAEQAQKDPVIDAAGEAAPLLVAFSRADLPLVEPLLRAYYLEDGHRYDADRQRAALSALADGEPLGRGWLVRLGERTIGYAVLTFGFSVEAGGLEGCVDEFYLLPEMRGRGLGSRVLALIEAEARVVGVRRLFLEVERGNRAIRLYRRAGFLATERHLMSKFLDR